MQKLQTVNAETLLYEPLEKPSFVVDSLIPTGLSLFCGSQKIGKSWLMLKLCLCVSQGLPLWDIWEQIAVMTPHANIFVIILIKLSWEIRLDLQSVFRQIMPIKNGT